MPEGIELLPLVSRWVHILSAIVAIGGSLFVRLMLMPTMAKVLDDEKRVEFRTALMRRWKPMAHATIVLFLVSGFYNYLAVTRFDHDDQPLYHALFGAKFLLAILVFAMSIILTSTMAWSTKLRESSALWYAFLAAGIGVVLIAGVMKMVPAAG